MQTEIRLVTAGKINSLEQFVSYCRHVYTLLTFEFILDNFMCP